MNLDAAIISAARSRWNRQQERISSKWPRVLWEDLSEEAQGYQIDEMRRIATDLLFDLEITDNRNDRRG